MVVIGRTANLGSYTGLDGETKTGAKNNDRQYKTLETKSYKK